MRSSLELRANWILICLETRLRGATPMNTMRRSGLVAGSVLSLVLLAGCVSQSDYDALKAQNEALQHQLDTQSSELAAAKSQIGRLQGAIKYTVNSDLLFPSGGWQLSARGKQIIARMAAKLAPGQQQKLLVKGYTDNTPIGPRLSSQGITSNAILSQKRADDVMQYLISQGAKPELVAAHGYGEADPVAPNTTAQGRAKNRRVELTLENEAG
jgi:chemotaxis protein MotB